MTDADDTLHNLLRLAAQEPAHRPEFCRVLLASQVFVIGRAAKADGVTQLDSRDRGEWVFWERPSGESVLPFFSSLVKLQQSLDREAPYLSLPARSLFEMTAGATLCLNPRSDYSKEFVPEEVEHLLFSGLSHEPESVVVQQEHQILLGQPAQYPAQMIDSLTQLFAGHCAVNKVYLAAMDDKTLSEKPTLLVAIDTSDNYQRIVSEAGVVAGDTLPKGESVLFMQIKPDEASLSEYLIRTTAPFYDRVWGEKLFAPSDGEEG